ncbi:hypothetical protein [Amycolatopsis anabasis]|uniref:hypothetical protein n=1 Tax=Amycolatopsis anabasis TaxID=1840409 RepID=UPI00131E801A|nr:hypothetical protein [Amycolatopsis anabasis]
MSAPQTHTPILRPGETLVYINDSPYFPAVLGKPNNTLLTPGFRRVVAEWVIAELNLTWLRGTNPLRRAEWRGDTILIFECEYEDDADYEPELIRPDERGLYRIADLWQWSQADPADIDQDDRLDPLSPDSRVALALLASGRDPATYTSDEQQALFNHVTAGGRDERLRVLLDAAATPAQLKRVASLIGLIWASPRVSRHGH